MTTESLTPTHRSEPPPEGAARVWLVFKTHLDLGFTAPAEEVLRQLRDEHIPRALAVARRGRRPDGSRGFVWTLGSWVVWHALERGTREQRAALERAIVDGDVAWHALPFSMHTELLDQWLLDEALGIAAELDGRFDTTTTAAKMTDVPGHTSALVPALVDAGVTLLDVGTNPAARMPDVPPAFRWSVDGLDLPVLYHGDYGGSGLIPGTTDGYAVEVLHENSGPPSDESIRAVYEEIRVRNPGADIVAGSLNDLAAAMAVAHSRLPAVKGEIGDSWIHGAGSSPVMIARYRALLDALRPQPRRTTLPVATAPVLSDSDRSALARALLLIPEHTWGLDSKAVLTGDGLWDAAEFSRRRERGDYRPLEDSWAAKAALVDRAIAAVGDPPGRDRLAAAAAPLTVEDVLGEADGIEKIDPVAPAGIGPLSVAFDAETGDLCQVESAEGVWAGGGTPLLAYRFQSFDAKSYERFFDRYIRPTARHEPWVAGDYGRPGLERTGAVAELAATHLVSVRRLEGPIGRERLVAELLLDTSHPAAPRRLAVICEPAGTSPSLLVTVVRTDKPASPFPYAEWLHIAPALPTGARLEVNKLGRWVAADSVVPGGGEILHGVDRGVRWRFEGTTAFGVESLDAILACPGKPRLLDTGLASETSSVSLNLSNNVWGTNFPLWDGADLIARVLLTPSDSATGTTD